MQLIISLIQSLQIIIPKEREVTALNSKIISYHDFLSVLTEEDKAVVMGLIYFEQADPDTLHQVIGQLEEKERDKIYDILERNAIRLRRENAAAVPAAVIPILGSVIAIVVIIIILLIDY